MYCYMDFPDAVSRAGVGHNVLLMDFPDVVSRAGVGHDVLLHGLPRRGGSGWGEARCTVSWTSQTR